MSGARETGEDERGTRKIRRRKEEKRQEHGKNGECTDTNRQLPSCSN